MAVTFIVDVFPNSNISDYTERRGAAFKSFALYSKGTGIEYLFRDQLFYVTFAHGLPQSQHVYWRILPLNMLLRLPSLNTENHRKVKGKVVPVRNSLVTHYATKT
jgi:hypothetical protein